MKIEDHLKKSEEIQGKATKVVRWYAHPHDGTVRGPWSRWFKIQKGGEGAPVAAVEDDVYFCAAAMNVWPLETQALKIAVEALGFYSGPDCGSTGQSIIKEHFKAKDALQKIEKILRGEEE